MIIAFTGLAQSGKSTAAQYLADKHQFARVKFADPLKTMLRALGLSERELEGTGKEMPCALLMGTTPRRAMQTLGTEWGRACIHSGLWCGLWQRTVGDVLDHGGNVVTDDVRFPDEAKAVKSMGGIVVRVKRTAGGIASEHVSEMQTFPVDMEIGNDGALDKFLEKIDLLTLVTLPLVEESYVSAPD